MRLACDQIGWLFQMSSSELLTREIEEIAAKGKLLLLAFKPFRTQRQISATTCHVTSWFTKGLLSLRSKDVFESSGMTTDTDVLSSLWLAIAVIQSSRLLSSSFCLLLIVSPSLSLHFLPFSIVLSVSSSSSLSLLHPPAMTPSCGDLNWTEPYKSYLHNSNASSAFSICRGTVCVNATRQGFQFCLSDGRCCDLRSKDSDLNEGPKYWLMPLLMWIPLITIFGNILVVLSVYKNKTLQNITNNFIVSLAIADISLAFMVMPLAIWVEVSKAGDGRSHHAAVTSIWQSAH